MRVKTAVAAGVIFVASLGLAAPATAQLSDCPSSEVCLFGSNGYVFLIAHRVAGLGNANLTGDANNQMDSWANLTSTNAAGYADNNSTGDCQTFAAASNDDNVNVFNSDEVSSWKTNGGC